MYLPGRTGTDPARPVTRRITPRQVTAGREGSAVPEYWRRALIRIVRYSLVWGCDDGQPDLALAAMSCCPVAASAITRCDSSP